MNTQKNALITGASRGIGAAAARALAARGFRVAVNYNTSEQAAGALALELGGTAVRADVSDPDAVKRMFAVLPPPDALVCNAGVALTGLFQDTAARWREVFDLNFGGAVNCINAALPHMLREKRGRIVIITSVWGRFGASCEAVYSASKAALHGLALSLAKELGPSGITVNCIAPGVIATDMNSGLGKAELDSLRERTP
ncbi:MAG: SDR family NAD(P)-dependent oxidoreductase, partial [Oscillospiraceae bacterium]|nr:SDR family NAD(P)-dependent oxidoreductase [Oscillospiraceae bacterium]